MKPLIPHSVGSRAERVTDVIEVGRNQLVSDVHRGDCLEVMRLLPDACVDMVFCDLPYGTTRNTWDSPIDLGALWSIYNRVVKKNGAIVLTASSPFDKVLAASNLDNFRYEWIWHKNKATGHLNAKRMPLKAHENVLVFYRKPPVYNPQFTSGHKPMNKVNPRKKDQPAVLRNYGHADCVGNPGGKTERYPRTVLDIPVHNNDDRSKFHPTQKPVGLAQYFIRTYSNPGDVILDNCMGSGSTGIAAIGEGRHFIGVEQDGNYFDDARAWLKSFIEQQTDAIKGVANG